MMMAWYFAVATVLSNGDVLVDAMKTGSEAQCQYFASHAADSPLDVSRSYRTPTTPKWWQRWSPPEPTLLAPYTLVAPCQEFDVAPTVILAADRKSIRMSR
jgi:hypothetical protein